MLNGFSCERETAGQGGWGERRQDCALPVGMRIERVEGGGEGREGGEKEDRTLFSLCHIAGAVASALCL